MAKSITRQSALIGCDQEGVFGADIQTPGIDIQQRRVSAITQLNGIDAIALERLQQHFGLDEAPPRRAIDASNVTLLWTGPQQWLLTSEQIETASLMSQLEEIMAHTDATVVDLSHSRVRLRITGSQTRALLAKGCPLDIESLTAGDCATTHLGAITVTIHWRENDACDLYVSRSFAVSLWEWLFDAAGEFGCHYSAMGSDWTHTES